MPMPRARMRIRYRRSPWAAVLPTFRWLLSVGLIAALVFGGTRFLARWQLAQALEFTEHLMSIETAAVGVQGMAASDLDADGDIDVVTAGKDGIKIYRQQDKGKFEAKIVDDKHGERVQIVDLNRDGQQDLLVGLRSTNPGVKWYRNDGSLEFTGSTVGTGNDGKAWAGDIDADGSPDIITALTDGGGNVVLTRWMNNGSGSFSSTELSADSGVKAIWVADVDGNGYPDVVTGGDQGVERWHTTDGLSWEKIDIDDSNTGQQHIYIADVNEDGKEDIVAAEPAGNLVTFYRNVDKRVFERIDLATGVDAITVQVIDLDEDGDEDVVAAAQDENSVYWFSNDGSEEFTKRTIATGLQSVFGVVVSDLDDDNDFDVVAGDHMRGTVYWYERTLAQPVATAPGNISQSTDGEGVVTFDTTLSDADFDTTRARIQYSLDGIAWYKPWLTSVSASAGSTDLKNSNGYQVGTSNAIDTDEHDSVKLTFTWDTQTSKNTGGPLTGDYDDVKLRIIPRDKRGNGVTQVSSAFAVDNQAPAVGAFEAAGIFDTGVGLTWDTVVDKNFSFLKVHYGTDHEEVLNENSPVWDSADDLSLEEPTSNGTLIIDLTRNTQYTFKLFAEDSFGNVASPPSVRVTTLAEPPAEPADLPPGPQSSPSVPEAPVSSFEPPPETSAAPSPEAVFVPDPASSPTPIVLPPFEVTGNEPPVADAGSDQLVNPGELVILDGTRSADPEGAALSYEWRQIVGPDLLRNQLSACVGCRSEIPAGDTATPSFTALGEDATYVFTLTVRDILGMISTDTVTIATRPELEEGAGIELPTSDDDIELAAAEVPAIVSSLLRPLDLTLLAVSLATTLVSLLERFSRALVKRAGTLQSLLRRRKGSGTASATGSHRIRIVDFKTGKALAGVHVTVRSANGKVWAKAKSDERGSVALSFSVGDYTIAVRAPGFTFSPAASSFKGAPDSVVYTGGTLNVKSSTEPMRIVVPMKPTGDRVGPIDNQVLRVWQFVQHRSHRASWPVFVIGAALNTGILLWVPQLQFLVIEIVYVMLVVSKIVVDLRVRPSYGLVRDAITHVPIDLAVVRLYDEDSNRLVMTRATNGQGRFFALPPPGVYTVSVAKPGYATFSKHNVEISGNHDESMQIKTELMPVAPQPGFMNAPAAT